MVQYKQFYLSPKSQTQKEQFNKKQKAWDKAINAVARAKELEKLQQPK